MVFLWLANLIAVTHALLVVCEVIGAAAAVTGVLRRHPRWERACYALLAAVIASDRLLGECLLTRWEKVLRDWHQPGSAYRGSCIGHYCPELPPAVLAWLVPSLIISAILAFPFWRWVDYRQHAVPRRKAGATPSGCR